MEQKAILMVGQEPQSYSQKSFTEIDLRTLAIFNALDGYGETGFKDLRHKLNISESVLSKRLSPLTAQGLVTLSLRTNNGRSYKSVAMTDAGKREYRNQSAAVARLLANVAP